MAKYISNAVQKNAMVDQITTILRRGPLSAIQIGKRIGKSGSNVSAVCYRNEDIFEKIEDFSTKKPTFLWKLKD
jgi:hypothetical protein